MNAFYVAAISALAARMPLAAVSTAGLTWCEVDDAADLVAAQRKVTLIDAEEAANTRVHVPVAARAGHPGSVELLTT